MSKPSVVKMTDLLIVVLVLASAVLLMRYVVHCRGQRGEARLAGCRGNLNQLGKGMWTYLNNHGDGRFLPWPAGRPGCGTKADPRFGGAEWLAAFYWAGFPYDRLLPDPGIFICPATLDSNSDGRDLGDHGCPGNKPLPPNAVSYAGMGDVSVGIYMASRMGKGASYATSRIAIHCDRLPINDPSPTSPIACDDTEEPINHGSRDNGGMNVLFFDSHVEWWTHERVDLERGVGAGELVHLRN